jgi:hypothetical protein
MSMPMAPPQPVMQMPATMMPVPSGFAPAMPHPSAPAAMPAAAPFPVAVPSPNVAPPATGPAAPPVLPPAAPQRPIDELENLTSQPTRRHFPKKKKKTDYTTEIIIGGALTAAGILFFLAYAAFTNQNGSKHGFDAIEPEKPAESVRAVMDSARKKFIEDLRKKDKEREQEKKKKTAADQDSRPGPRRIGADNAGTSFPKPYDFSPPTRAMDSAVPASPKGSGQPSHGIDSPDGLKDIADPVMEKPASP